MLLHFDLNLTSLEVVPVVGVEGSLVEDVTGHQKEVFDNNRASASPGEEMAWNRALQEEEEQMTFLEEEEVGHWIVVVVDKVQGDRNNFQQDEMVDQGQ